MKFNELKEYLFSLSDKKFADFSKTLSNSEYLVIGVKNPILRQIIKEHKDDQELDTKDFVLGEYLEIDFIYFGLSLIRLSKPEAQLEFLYDEIYQAKSWVITDCVSTYLKKVTFKQFYEFFLTMHNSTYTYDRRMAYVLGLKFYREHDIVKVLPKIQLNEEYMVMMAEAWLLSVMALTQEDAVFNYLSNCPDEKLKRKAISKINESFRYSEESKNRFKSLR